ncbi:hypothetical protein ATEIFO6365_0011033900 [Aspergillus terreus]|uniref:Uncharacterized protein n=1 Tax=Aspergillus terreus TaxID=33178 RepID=A0A5M3YYW2_ASPTE|nr:hypothetical protein ATETN484_0006033900 [Aspergillus terreus]GFF20079.1 hypothetical protein ATEIFO6365_0011033900 [Aspergillus terreus]
MPEMKKPLAPIPLTPTHLPGAHHTVPNTIPGQNDIDTHIHTREALKHEREALRHEREALKHERAALLASNKHNHNPRGEPYAMAAAFLSIREEVEKTFAAEKEQMQQEIAELKEKVNEKEEKIARAQQELVNLKGRLRDEIERHYSECESLRAKIAKLRADLGETDECRGSSYGVSYSAANWGASDTASWVPNDYYRYSWERPSPFKKQPEEVGSVCLDW